MTMSRAGSDRRRIAVCLRRELRASRLKKGMTQAEVAEAAGISTEFYSRLERMAALPSLPMLMRLRSVLDMNVTKIFD